MKVGPEDIEQIKVCEFVKQCTDLPFIHTANERRCSPQQGAFLKRKGVLAGVADIFIPRAHGKYHGLFIELKTLKGKPTPAQIKFLDNMNKEKYFALVCYGAEETIETIKTFYNLPTTDVFINRL
jgi:hypothetical protein